MRSCDKTVNMFHKHAIKKPHQADKVQIKLYLKLHMYYFYMISTTMPLSLRIPKKILSGKEQSLKRLTVQPPNNNY